MIELINSITCLKIRDPGGRFYFKVECNVPQNMSKANSAEFWLQITFIYWSKLILISHYILKALKVITLIAESSPYLSADLSTSIVPNARLYSGTLYIVQLYTSLVLILGYSLTQVRRPHPVYSNTAKQWSPVTTTRAMHQASLGRSRRFDSRAGHEVSLWPHNCADLQ